MPKGCQQRADRAAAQALLAAGDDDHEQDARQGEVAQAVEEGAGAQERVPPQEAHALGDLRADGRVAALAHLLERRPDQGERRQRGRIRAGVDDERQRPRDPEQEPPEWRPGQVDRRDPGRHGRDRVRELGRRHHRAQRPGRRDGEGDGGGALDQRDHGEEGEGRVPHRN